MARPGQQTQLAVLTIELVVVATLVGVGPTFPRDVPAGTAWSFLGSHALEAAHAGLGALVLIQAVVLVVSSRRSITSVVLAAGVATAVASGATYVSAGQADTPLTVMTLGWLVSLVAAVVGLARGRRGSVRETG
ncbi:MAG: hypothetical protein KDB63_15425 [Nocardioidaceae bacterium]|nr:hypothetical protein [Nocardioidaceae bacterium]